MSKTKRFVQWFGANTENAELPGTLLDGCRWVGIPFAGGMSEVPFFTAKQILVNDAHHHIINLCRVVSCERGRAWLAESADAMPYHPEVLRQAQAKARDWDPETETDWYAALAYFVVVWMGRGGKAGTDGELDGKLPIRWNADGGGSNRRYRTAIEALEAWGDAFRRCEFTCMDAVKFLERVDDRTGHGLYIDAPWPDAGDVYQHKFTGADQRRLATKLSQFTRTRVVVRFGEHPLIRELYLDTYWHWIPLESRTQANERKPEFLICNWRDE